MNLYQTIQSWLVKLVSKMNHKATYSQREEEREAEEYRQWREEYYRANQTSTPTQAYIGGDWENVTIPKYIRFRPKRKSRSAPTKSTRKAKR